MVHQKHLPAVPDGLGHRAGQGVEAAAEQNDFFNRPVVRRLVEVEVLCQARVPLQGHELEPVIVLRQETEVRDQRRQDGLGVPEVGKADRDAEHEVPPPPGPDLGGLDVPAPGPLGGLVRGVHVSGDVQQVAGYGGNVLPHLAADCVEQ